MRSVFSLGGAGGTSGEDHGSDGRKEIGRETAVGQASPSHLAPTEEEDEDEEQDIEGQVGVGGARGLALQVPPRELSRPGKTCNQVCDHPLQLFLADVQWEVVCCFACGMMLIQLFWSSWLLFPLKLLVVFLHEFSHALAAYATGGRVTKIELDSSEGGVCWTIGGNRFITLSAGYLGSLAWGGGILLVASRTRMGKQLSMALGVLLGYIGLRFVRPLGSFGQYFVLGSSAGLFATGWWLPELANELTLRVMGLTCCMYAVLDIKSDILDRPYVHSDAAILAEITGIPAILCGFLWISTSVVCTVYFLLLSSKPQVDVHCGHLPTSESEPSVPWQVPTDGAAFTLISNRSPV